MRDHFHNGLAWLLDHTFFRITFDLASVAAIAGAIAGWLPPLAALAGLAWYGVLFYDRFLGRDSTKRG